MTLEQVLKWKPGTRVTLSGAGGWYEPFDRVPLVIDSTDVYGRVIRFKENKRAIINVRFGGASEIQNMPNGVQVNVPSGWARIELMEGRNKL